MGGELRYIAVRVLGIRKAPFGGDTGEQAAAED